MKFSRSYLLGLGSGLILSALIAMVIPAGNIKFNEETTPVNNQEASRQDTQNNEFLTEKPETENLEVKEGLSPVTKVFIIPAGATAEKIANLLLEEGWISHKEEFLNLVKQKNLASKFQVGSYELTQGMSVEEVINQLIPKPKY